MIRPPPSSTLFPSTPLFRSSWLLRAPRGGRRLAPLRRGPGARCHDRRCADQVRAVVLRDVRSEEHTSELQSQSNLVCRLLLEKKNTTSTMSLQMYYDHTNLI